MAKEPVQQFRYIFFTLYILLQVSFILFSEYNFGVGGIDNIRHYQNARFYLLHPELFFDAWGKPLFTTLLWPFTLLGFKVARVLNLIISVFILLFTLKIADRFYKGNSLILLVLISFTPVYFFLSTSCLPQLLFGLLLIAGIYFMLENRPSLSAVIISFLPLVYTYGFIILAIFICVLVLVKSYRSIFLLLTGTVIFSMAGYFVIGDIFWLAHHFTNSSGKIVANTSDLIYEINFNIGFPLLLLLISGFGIWTFDVLKKFSISNKKTIYYLLVVGNFLAFLVIVLYSGSKSETIYLSVALVLLAALIGGETINFLYKKNRIIAKVAIVGFALIQVVLLFATNKFSFKIDGQIELAKKGANYIQFNEPNGKLYYFNPLIPFYLNIDPSDSLKSSLITKGNEISKIMDWDDLLVWDSEFGKVKYGVDLKILEDDSNLEKSESFYLHDKTVKISENDSSIHIFKKLKVQKGEFAVSDTYERTLSFEDYINPSVKDIDGVKVWVLDSTQEYSQNIVLAPDIVVRKEIFEFTISIKYKAIQSLEKGQALLVFSTINEGKNIHYKSNYLVSLGNNWVESEMKVTIPADIPRSSKILIYVWNKDRRQFIIERITVNARSY